MTDYCTSAELKAGMNKTGTGDDTTLAILITAASRAIDRFCNRPDDFFVAIAAGMARYYVGTGKPYQWIDECISVSAVAVKDSISDSEDEYTAWTLGTLGTTDGDCLPASGDPQEPDYTTTPYNMLVIQPNGDYSSFTGGVYTTKKGFMPDPDTNINRGIPTVKVTARWGYAATVPTQIKTACMMQSARWYKRMQGAMADALASSDIGTMIYTQELDPDIGFILRRGRFVKPAIGRR